MSKMLADLSVDEIYAFLDEYVSKMNSGIIEFSNEADVPTEEIVLLVGALAYVEETNESKFFNYLDLYKSVQGEFLDRVGDIPLQ